MLTTIAFTIIEKSINFMLSRDESSASRLAALEDKSICIDFTDLPFNMVWLFEHQRVRLVSELSTKVDATIAGTLQAIARMGLSNARIAKDLTVSGDMHVVEAFKQLFADLDLNLAEQLAPFIGDAAAFKLDKTAKQSGDFLHRATKSIAGSSTEYLQEEINLLPAKLRLTEFSADVRQLSRDLDRLTVRVKRLQR